MATRTLTTIEELERMPDGEHFELIRGELHEVTPPGERHGEIQLALGARLYAFVEEHKLGRAYGEIGVVFAQEPHTVLSPDLAFVRSERMLPEAQAGFLRQVPDLVVEIVSPSNTAREIRDKLLLYLGAGVSMIWVVDPRQKRVMVWTDLQTVQELHADDTLDGGDVLPDFRLPLTDIFR